MIHAGYEKLLVWQKADELAYQIYMASKAFPREELYAMTSQVRRAALSVPTNLVEGYARQGRNEFRQFTNIALGSLAEARYLLGFCLRRCLKSGTGILPVGLCGIGILPMIHGLEAHATMSWLLKHPLRLEYLKLAQHKRLETQGEEVGRLLWGLYQSLGGRSDK